MELEGIIDYLVNLGEPLIDLIEKYWLYGLLVMIGLLYEAEAPITTKHPKIIIATNTFDDVILST